MLAGLTGCNRHIAASSADCFARSLSSPMARSSLPGGSPGTKAGSDRSPERRTAASTPSFGESGFSIDHRLPPASSALAIQPDGRILAAAVGGSLARYLPDGAIDPSFGGRGNRRTDEPGQVHFLFANYGSVGAARPTRGGIVVSGNHSLGGGGTDGLGQALRLRRGLDERNRSGRPSAQRPRLLGDQSTRRSKCPDGSLVGAGSSYGYEASKFLTQPLLARFVPGSGSMSSTRPSAAVPAWFARFGPVTSTGRTVVASARRRVAGGGRSRRHRPARRASTSMGVWTRASAKAVLAAPSVAARCPCPRRLSSQLGGRRGGHR